MSEIDINSITPGYTGDKSGESKPSDDAHKSITQSLSDWFGTWDDYASAAEDGYQRSQSWDEASALWNSGKNTSDKVAQKYIDAINEYDQNYSGRLLKYEDWSQAYDKYDEEYNDVTSFLLATWEKGIDGLAQVTVQSMAGYAKQEVLARGVAGATVGVLGGPQGMMAGGFGAMGAATETMITFGELLKEELGNKGLAFDVDGISELRDNHPDAWQSVKTRATARGLTIGSVEGITSLIGIKGSKRVAKRYLNKYGSGLVGKTTATAAGGSVAFAAEAGGGMLGEVAGSEVAGQDYTAKDVLVEGFAGIGTAPVTAATGVGSAIVNRPKYKINGAGVSKSLFDRYTVNATDQEIAEMDLDVVNDEQLAEKLFNRQQKAIMKTQIDTRVTDDATRDKLADLELELFKLGKNDTESANLQKKDIKLKIKELVDANAGIEVDKNLESTKKSVLEARSERDISRAEKLGEKLNKKVERVNNSNYEQKFLELGGKKEQFDLTGVGVIVDGTVLLNEDTIKQGGFLNVGAHEILHAVIGDTFSKMDVDGKVKLVKDFTGILSDNQRNAIERRLRNDYSIDMEGNFDSLFSDDLTLETWVDRDNLGEEVFTVFSEAILDGEIGYEETLFDAMKNKVEEILRVIGIRKEFENGRQVYNFLKDYNKNVAKGEVSKRTEKFAKVDSTSDKTNFRKNYDEDYGYDDNFDESFDLDSDVESDLTPKEKKKYEKTKRDEKLNKIGEKYTKAQWDKFGYNESMPQWYEDVEKIIKNNISSSLRALPNFSETDFISEAFIELSKHIKNFNVDKKKTDNGFGLSGWIRGQVSNKIGEVLKSKKATTDTFTADTSAEQFKELEATDVESMDESEDLSIGAQQKKQALTERRESKGLEADVEYSKTRRKIKFGDTVGLAPSVVRAVKSAASKVLSTTKIDPTDKNYKDKLNKGFLTELKNEMQGRFGSAAEFKKFLAANRETIVDALPTSTWVQIERNEENKIFVKYLRKLTKQADIQEAVDQGLIPASFRNKESVDLYMKVMPTEEQFLEFYNPPAKVYSEKKGAMVRSGLKGTRKDTLAEQLGAELAFDATMEVLMDEDVQERVSLANGQPFDAQQIAAAINRGVDVRFNKRSEKITSGMVREVSGLLGKLESKKIKFTDVITLSKDSKGKTVYSLTNPITKKFIKSGKATYSKKDSALMAEITAKVFFSNKYGSIQNKDTYNKVLKGLVERRNDSSKKALAAYRVHEQLFINIIGDAVKNDLTLSVNRYIEEGGKGDVYITKGKTNVGIEIKMHEAFGVSQTINFTINNKGEYVFNSTNPNTVDKAAEQALLDATAESLDLVSDMLETAGLGKIKGMEITKEQVDFIDTYFLKTQMNNITTTSAEYVAAHYGDKAMPEGFIQVGDKFMRLKTKNARVNKLVNEITEATGVEIPYFEAVDGAIPLIIKAQTVKLKNGKYKLNFRIMPKISSDALVDSKANLLNEKFAAKFGKATSNVLVNYAKRQNAKNLAKAIKNTTKPGYLKNTKGMSAFDFDETLIIDGENFIVATKDDRTVKISSGDWPLKGPKFAREGYSFDFTDFVNVRGGIDGPLMKKFKSRLKRYGAENTFILTARPQEAAPAIHGWLKAKGLEIPMENITGLGSSLGASKADWMIEKYAEGYNDMYFVDDALPNVEAVKDALDQLDAKSNVQLAKVMFSKSKYNSSQDPYSWVDFKTVPKEIVNSKSYKNWIKSLEGIKLFHGTVIDPSDISKRGTNHSLNWFLVGGNNNEQAISLAKNIEREFDGEPENSVLSIDASELAGRILPDADYIGPSDAMSISNDKSFQNEIKALEDKYKASTRVQSMIQIPAMYAEFLDIITEYNPMSGFSQTLFDKNGKLSTNTAVVVVGGLKPNQLKVESTAKVNYSRKKNTPIFKARMTKARPDLNAKQIDTIVGSVFDFTESDAVPIQKRNKFENLAYNYIENGFVILPEDGYKIIEAERLATIKKIDPMSVNNPNEIIEKYAGTVKAAKTNPDTVKEFSNKKDLGNGVVTYDVEQTKEGQLAVRKVIDTHFGKKSNPWCLAAREDRLDQEFQEFSDKDEADRYADDLKERGYETEVFHTESEGTYEVYGDLMFEPGDNRELDNAYRLWEKYQEGGKGYQVVFTDGKLSHFKDGSGKYWDRMDAASDYISKKLNDIKTEDGFTQKRELNVNTGKEVLGEKSRVTGNRQDGTYTSIVIDKVGTLDGSTIETTVEQEEVREKGKLIYQKKLTTDGDESYGGETKYYGDRKTITNTNSHPEGLEKGGSPRWELETTLERTGKIAGVDLKLDKYTETSFVNDYKKAPASPFGNNASLGRLFSHDLYTEVGSKHTVKGELNGKNATVEIFDFVDVNKDSQITKVKVNGKTVYTAPKVNFSKKNQAQADVFNQFDIKSEKQQARINFSKKADIKVDEFTEGMTESILDRRLNELVERSSGIDASKSVSRTEANRKGKYVGKTRLFIPPGAEDFVGLMYPLLGDNKQGDADMKFIKDNLLDPLSRGERAVANKKQRIMNGYKEIKAKHYKAHGMMGKLIPGSVYTYGHAVRVQMWSEMGIEVPGISSEEVAELVSIVLKDENISDYAISLEDLFMNEYPAPGEHWVGETIAHDMIGATLKTNRKLMLSEFIENADQFFSDKNMNKLESVYGTKWREAMEDMLFRIKNGTNRQSGTSGPANKWLNWVNASVGSIMFLNGRSAALQLLSTVNYINHKENNIFAAGAAFANQKQFWADFSYLWNSDFLKQRRSGLQTDISQAEIASAVAGASNKASAAINYLLKKGFLPTQMADSFAISSGGASFYRNKVNSLVKQGVSQAEAEAQAFTEFQELTEESQQSSRPDRISSQQASPLGRLILAFQNTPMQYARIIKKSVMDLQAGRGDKKSHLSKIAWYGGIQSAIFGALQSGLFLDLFDDEEDMEEMTEAERVKYQEMKDMRVSRTLTMMYSSIINGAGFTGRVISTALSTAQEFQTQREKGFGSSENRVLLTALSISPPISSKAQKLSKAATNIFWNEGAIEEMDMNDIDHPYYRSIALLAESAVNIPADRAWKKFNNLRAVFDAQNSTLQKALLLAGWDPYTLEVEDINRSSLIEAKQLNKDKKREDKKRNKKRKPTKNDMNPFAKPSKRLGSTKSSSYMDNPTAVKAINIKPSSNDNELSGEGSFRCQNISMAGAQCKNLTNNKSKRCYLHD